MTTWIETPDSTTMTRFRYAKETRVLSVEYRNGGRYDYFDVPEMVFDRMKAAPSKGQFLAQNIRSIFRYARA